MKTSKILLAVVLGSSGALLGAGLATTDARAQNSTTGAVQGRVTDSSSGSGLAGVTIVISGNSSQTTITEEDGSYRITDLTPGEYLVTFFFGDVTIERRGIKIGVNKTIPLFQKINTQQAVQETIVIDDKPPAIDPTSTTQGITIDQDYTKNIPVPGRTFEATLGAAAGSQNDGVGVSFSGSSSLENQYVVDGVNTTGLKYGTVGSPVINDFIEEIEVITGGYNAEYGRATGGVVNVATLTGGNEFEGRVFAYITPGQLTATRERTPSQATSVDATVNSDIDANVGFTLTGPIIKDRVWFAVGLAPRYIQSTVTRITKRRQDCQQQLPDGTMSACDPIMFGDSTPDVDPATGFLIYQELDSSKLRPNSTALSTLAKVNFAVRPEHQGQVSFSVSPTHSNVYGVYGLRTSMDYQQDTMGIDGGLKWTSKFNDSKTEVEAVLGWHRDQVEDVANAAGARHIPYEVLYNGTLGNWGNISDLNGNLAESAFTNAGCKDEPPGGVDQYPNIPNCPDVGVGYRVGGFGSIIDNQEDRYSVKLGVTRRQKFYGNHEIKAGVDAEDNLADEPRAYTGGVFFQNFRTAILVNRFVQIAPRDTTDPKFNSMCQYGNGQDEIVPCRYIGETGEGARVQGETLNWSAYLRDSWQIRPNLTLNAGVRYEEQRLRFAEYVRDEFDPLTGRPFGKNAIIMKGMVAPRIGLLYDWTREGRSKIYGHWGRFYESIPMDINSRSFAGEATFRQQYAAADCGTAPVGYGAPSGNGCDIETPAPGTIIGLEGTVVAPGLKPQYLDERIAGVEYELMEDLKLGIAYQHRSLGRVIEDVSTDGASTYVIANPGEWSADEEHKLEAQLAAATDPTEQERISNLLTQFRGIRMFDKPSRNYDALQFTVSRRFSKALYMQGSYTYSKTKGNYPGLISYDNGQIDPNISSQYDLIELLSNRYGPLNQDRPHYIKLDGYYKFDLKKAGELTVGTRLRALSGVPRQAQASHWLYGQGESFLLPRGQIGRSQFETGIDLHVGYGKKLAKNMELEVFADLFNLVNNQGVAGVDDFYSYTSSSNPISGGSYEDLIWAKQADDGPGAIGGEIFADGNPRSIERNPNYGNTNSRYAPRSVQFGARLSF